MRKQFELIFVLLILVSGTFALLAGHMSPTVGATYVEGAITQDTLWTLVDSPFVASKDVIVYPNATLTIEPGVEVRFGKDLGLMVQGNLSAVGSGRTIVFTSNHLNPNPGYWHGIQFENSPSSTLDDVAISYATQGVYAVNSGVSITNSRVYHASENGLRSSASTLSVQYCEFANNLGGGINLTGTGNVYVEHNLIMANGDGVVVTGTSSSGVHVLDNRIFANLRNGLYIDATTHADITISNNTVSSNDNGFYISSTTSTYISNNSVSFNNIGFYYSAGNHQATNNDIYDNGLGMDVTPSAVVVDAESNYWGSSNGPYNEWLNPQGRGNPVGGNGTDLDFIFYLTHPIGYINIAPAAEILADKTYVIPDQPVTFVATNSVDDGHIDYYSFSFGDGISTGWTTLSIAEHKYAVPAIYTVTLTVMDDFGALSIDSMPITVNASLTRALSIGFDANVTSGIIGETEDIALTVHVTVGTSPIGNVPVNMAAVKGGAFSIASGLTDANGDFLTVYTAPDVADITNVKVIATVSAGELSYSDEASSLYFEVRPLLSVQVSSDPDMVKSEGSTLVTVLVKSNDEPVSGATITISTTDGQLSMQTGLTNLNGLLLVNYTAPIIVTQTPVLAMVTATASKEGFSNGLGAGAVIIEPRTLSVTITADADNTISGGRVNMTVSVTYESEPIPNANVSIWATNGNLSASMKVTDGTGTVLFGYTAPWVNSQTAVVVSVTAAADRYAEGNQTTNITVDPRTFNITFNPSSVSAESGQAVAIEVRVKCVEDDTVVADAVVIVVSDLGTFAELSQTTDAAGVCSFTYTAPQTTTSLNVSVTVGATREGFVAGESHTFLIVNPSSAALSEGGFPWLMLLLIVIPVVIAVVVVVLIKLRVIVLSSSEEPV